MQFSPDQREQLHPRTPTQQYPASAFDLIQLHGGISWT